VRPGSTPGAVLFDAGNTLVYLDGARVVPMLRAEGIDSDARCFAAAESAARARLQAMVREGHVGTEPEVWAAYFETLFEASGVPPDLMEAVTARLIEEHRADHLWTHVESGTHEVLERLTSDGYRLGVISNADGRMESVIERVGIRNHFDFVIDSETVGMEKPDPAIFLAGCEAVGLPPNRCLYVGDLYPVDYLGARRAGLDAVLIDPLGVHPARVPTVTSLAGLAGLL
jgi:HAD superfamily hydrolase (TIGR01549 family)